MELRKDGWIRKGFIERFDCLIKKLKGGIRRQDIFMMDQSQSLGDVPRCGSLIMRPVFKTDRKSLKRSTCLTRGAFRNDRGIDAA